MQNILKEIDSLQQEINSYRPLNSNLLKMIKEYYRIGLTYSSNALEGNSLTESETKIVLEEGITIGGKPLKDHLEAIGHSEAYNFLLTLVNNKNITEENIKHLHKLIYFRIDDENAGIYRKNKSIITGSKYSLPKPEELSSLMKKFISSISKTRKEKHPIEAAAIIHKEFVFIHPFIDGNGRCARLLMNLILLQEGYNIAIIPLVTRKDYVETLEKAHVNDKDFIKFIARMIRETQKDHLRLFYK
ncbi:MAG: Fic family protein [Candidatus Lokiarchaeota archaeon]|nr:Fic family protein [Candidatus Lokiarchaeota archaeon]